MKIAGAILAGGRSRRFGSDKALAELGGEPLLQWSLDALRRVTNVVAINGPAELAAQFSTLSVTDDADAPRGPLAGIVAALRWARSEGCTHVLTTPCDTPFLPHDLGANLIAAIGEAPVAAARAERVHALCALWRVDALDRLAPLAARADQPSLQEIIDDLGGLLADFPQEADFANLNTHADWVAAKARWPLP